MASELETPFCQNVNPFVLHNDGAAVKCDLFRGVGHGQFHADHSHDGAAVIWPRKLPMVRTMTKRVVRAVGASVWGWCVTLGEQQVIYFP